MSAEGKAQLIKSDSLKSPTRPLFAELSQEEINFIASKGSIKVYQKGVQVICEGEMSDEMYVIISGRVRVYANDDLGREVVLNIQDAGEYFGEIALIDETPRSASVVTVENTVLSEISRKAFDQCLEERPQMAGRFLSGLTQRIRYLTNSVKNLALNDVHGRIVYTLTKLAEDHEGEMVVKIPLTHKDISLMVGSSREMVSKLMKQLHDKEFIETRDHHIVLRKSLVSD